MTNHLANTLEAAICDRQLLSHPFYQRWEAGELSFEELRHYAEQYRYFEEMLPQFLRQLAEELPDGVARESVLRNLADEVAAPSHLELFERFAAFYDASDEPISFAMQRLVDAYFEVLTENPAAALAGLWAYESQGAGIADSKAEGLAQHYGANRDALAFWLAHGSIEGDHAKWTLEALAAMEPDVDDVESAARLVANAWWSFLDERESLSA
jgi:pyrroloquinoline-quinone synthase